VKIWGQSGRNVAKMIIRRLACASKPIAPVIPDSRMANPKAYGPCFVGSRLNVAGAVSDMGVVGGELPALKADCEPRKARDGLENSHHEVTHQNATAHL
jgi:hypothetical protein